MFEATGFAKLIYAVTAVYVSRETLAKPQRNELSRGTGLAL
jgi:hypothetical protein